MFCKCIETLNSLVMLVTHLSVCHNYISDIAGYRMATCLLVLVQVVHMVVTIKSSKTHLVRLSIFGYADLYVLSLTYLAIYRPTSSRVVYSLRLG